MEEQQAEKWPLDFLALKKGDVIDVPQLERITGHKAGSVEYSFEVMKLRGRIEIARRDADCPISLRQENNQLLILTDAEASEYNANMIDQRIRQMKASFRRLAEVDRELLTSEQRSRHDAEVIQKSRMVQAVLAERRAIEKENRRAQLTTVDSD